MELKHITVLKSEAIQYLNIKADGIYVDATLGGGGHSLEIAKRLKTGLLYGFDQDRFAISYAKSVLKDFDNVRFVQSNFENLKTELAKANIFQIDGILFDLGLSSFQIDDENRGFSYLKNAKLDMRMNQDQTLSAYDIVNTYEVEELARIFYLYGEERNGYKIAKLIIKKRPIETTIELVKICDHVNYKEKGHSSKRVFQALRIAVNQELTVLENMLEDAFSLLKPGGRMVAITFHSLEDRIVKHFFKNKSEQPNIKNLPVMMRDQTQMRIITRKPVYPSQAELDANPRSQSAKLRAAEKK